MSSRRRKRRSPRRFILDKLDGDLPGFDGGTEWINSTPLTPKSLKGKVVLVDFWAFMCYNCLNTMPHVKELYAKYRNRGFVVVGVHTPELGPERVSQGVHDAVKRLGITFPVVTDNDNKIWNAYHNQYWPAAYFADATGKLRFYNFGEGRYDEQDKVVAKLLAERECGGGDERGCERIEEQSRQRVRRGTFRFGAHGPTAAPLISVAIRYGVDDVNAFSNASSSAGAASDTAQ